MSLNAGVCKIKEEFIFHRKEKLKVILDDEVRDSSSKRKLSHTEDSDYIKIPKQDPCENLRNKKFKKRGQNKARPKTFRDSNDSKPCPSIINITSENDKKACEYANCKYIHDPITYLKSKPEDIGKDCHIFALRGFCIRGIACRYGSIHLTPEGYNIVDKEKYEKWCEDIKNTIQPNLQNNLHKKKYDFSLAENLVKCLHTKNDKNKDSSKSREDDCDENSISKVSQYSGAVTDEDVIKLLPREKKTINWKNKLYLSPLTTVGNLPFRRICKQFGADITCGEMALCESLLKGLKQEWALVKRHDSEDIFGAQICGNNPYAITKVSQLLQENANLDFIDLNLGCPIDLIYRKGGGSGMMHRLSTLETSVRCASKLLSVPFTMKMRTGVYQDKKIAHNIVPKVAEWGASLITLHGRSKEARYTKLADWNYIEICAQGATPCPVFGNGDIFSYEDYIQKRELAPSIHGVMIGRGALVKPWLFTEIKEQKLWDISSNERFDIIKKFSNYGLEHWGSDTQGVENTRRFLLEWLSFLYRYVPVGLLETPPQKINERPPTYFGRNDLETLMASGNCEDWIKISEMLLGPVPEGFKFLPKHKANSY